MFFIHQECEPFPDKVGEGSYCFRQPWDLETAYAGHGSHNNKYTGCNREATLKRGERKERSGTTNEASQKAIGEYTASIVNDA